MIAERDELIA